MQRVQSIKLIFLICSSILLGCQGEQASQQSIKYDRIIAKKDAQISQLRDEITELKSQKIEMENKYASLSTANMRGNRTLEAANKTAENYKKELAETRKSLGDIGKKYSALLRALIARGTLYPKPGEELIVHYWRESGNYDNWGVHAWGPAIKNPVAWEKPIPFNRKDEYGAISVVTLSDKNAFKYDLNFLIHNGSEKDTLDNRSVNAGDTPEIWLVENDSTIYFNQRDAAAAIRRIKRKAK